MDPREEFEYWLADMDDALDRFLQSLPAGVSSQLDYSIDSLNALEAWILTTYADSKDMLVEGQTANLNGAARYIGEAMRKILGGHWDIDLKNKNNVYFGLPVITGFSPQPTPQCPMTLATATASRRDGRFLATVFANLIRRYGPKGVA
jgi:hypothetical protein